MLIAIYTGFGKPKLNSKLSNVNIVLEIEVSFEIKR